MFRKFAAIGSMTFIIFAVLAAGSIRGRGVVITSADNTPATANSDPTYLELRKVGLSGETVATNNLVVKRDAAVFTLKSGNLYFLNPVKGKVTGAVFVGTGSFSMTPPVNVERRQLGRLTGQESIDEEFDQLVLRFTDGTYDEIKKQTSVTPGAANGQASSILNDIQSTLRRKLHTNLSGRILQDIMNDQPGGLFVAFIKGKKFSGKMVLSIDPLGNEPFQPEEVLLYTYDDNNSGYWSSCHYAEEYANRRASSSQATAAIHIEKQQLDTGIEKNGRINGNATTTFVSQVDGLKVVPFDLFPTLRVQSVTDVGGQALSFIQEDKNDDPDYFVILPKSLAKGERFAVKATYSGTDAISNEGGGNYYPIARTNWYPSSSFGDYAEYQMTFRIPKGLAMVATGVPVSDANEGNENISVWRSEVPMAVAGFNFGRFKKDLFKNDKTGFTFETYANTEVPSVIKDLQGRIDMAEREGLRPEVALGSMTTTGMMKKAMSEARLAIDLYTSYYGPISYTRVAMTQQTALNYGQAWPSLVYLPMSSFYDSTIRHQLGMDDAHGYFKIVAPHEVAHQWWGHTVGFNSYRDQWMSEGFAEFSASLFIERFYKQSDAKAYSKFWADELQSLTQRNSFGNRANDVGPVIVGRRLDTSKSGSIYDKLVYPKGGFILHMIRWMMYDKKTTDTRFATMMQEFVKTYADRTATTEDFKAMVEKHMTPDMNLTQNGKMDWFFNEYVYGMAIPTYKFEYSFADGADGKPVIKIKTTQSGVDKDFMMRVPVYVEFNNGVVTRLGSMALFGNSSNEQSVPLSIFAEKPKRLLINANYDVLATPQ